MMIWGFPAEQLTSIDQLTRAGVADVLITAPMARDRKTRSRIVFWSLSWSEEGTFPLNSDFHKIKTMIMLKHAMVQKMQIEAIPHSNHEMTSVQKFSFRPPLGGGGWDVEDDNKCKWSLILTTRRLQDQSLWSSFLLPSPALPVPAPPPPSLWETSLNVSSNCFWGGNSKLKYSKDG